MIPVSELYTSVQGEGPNTGRPIQFLRLGGCNMRCPGWPCDTPQAIYPKEWGHEWVKQEIEDIVERVEPWPKHVCLTGGEPFLHNETPELVRALTNEGYEVDIFTNGSFNFTPQVIYNPLVYIIMDWKLAGSGQGDTALEQRIRNTWMLADKPRHGIKFVVKDLDDLEEARQLSAVYADVNQWVGAVWGKIDDQDIVDFMLRHNLPWRLNIQTHKYVWDPFERFT